MASGELKVGRFMLGVTGYLVEEGMRSWMWATASFALVARMAKLTGVLCGGLECCRPARVDTCHWERLAGFQRDAIRLLLAVRQRLPFIVAVGEHHAVAAAE